MTKVLLYRQSDGSLGGYEVSGHTGFAESGHDIVCSALSFLSITCANALESLSAQKPGITQRRAYLRVETADRGERTQTILKVFELGIRDLEANYPDYFRLTVIEPQR